MVADYKRKYEEVMAVIEDRASICGRDISEISLMAVTKNHSLDEITEMYRQTGLTLLGENRVQEAEPKILSWEESITPQWHLVGHLQRNKARKALELFSMIQSLDSKRLADTLQRICHEKEISTEVLIEVNTSGEESKHGVAPEETAVLAEHVLSECPDLDLKGMMTVGPLKADEKGVRKSFASLRELRDRVSSEHKISLPVLSMGMTGDFGWAIEEGSTLVRIGTGLLGERQY